MKLRARLQVGTWQPRARQKGPRGCWKRVGCRWLDRRSTLPPHVVRLDTLLESLNDVNRRRCFNWPPKCHSSLPLDLTSAPIAPMYRRRLTSTSVQGPCTSIRRPNVILTISWRPSRFDPFWHASQLPPTTITIDSPSPILNSHLDCKTTEIRPPPIIIFLGDFPTPVNVMG